MASAAWERRNARARALGYESYYDYRAHDNGRRPPSAPRLKGEALAASRGHRSAADLERLLASGRVELVNTVQTVDAQGRQVVDVLATLADGSTREFRLRGEQIPRIGEVIDAMGTEAPPLIGSPRALANFADLEEIDEELEEHERVELDTDELDTEIPF